jgi:hypothetical protein
MKKYISTGHLLKSMIIRLFILCSFFQIISMASLFGFKSESSHSFSSISNAMAELPEEKSLCLGDKCGAGSLHLPSGKTVYPDEPTSVSEAADKAKYEDIEKSVKDSIGTTAVSSSKLADLIKTTAALFGIEVKVDYDKKGGLSCFTLDDSGALNVVSCSGSGSLISSCEATAATDWKSATISCIDFELKAIVVE